MVPPRYRTAVALGVPLLMGLIGWRLDVADDQRMTMFRNKSALYGRELKPGEKQPW